jgi:hypothetical protein
MSKDDKIPTTAELVNEDGVLDEKAAGKAIDKIIEKTNKESLVSLDDEPKAESVEKIPDKDLDSDDNEEPVVDGWVNSEEMQELIDSLGYTQEDASQFSNETDFQTHVRLLDKEFKSRKKVEEQDIALEVNEALQRRDLFGDKVDEEVNKLPSLDPDEFDEQLIEVLNARDEKIAQLERKLNESSQENVVKQFDRIVDELGHEEIFGNSDDLTKGQQKQREKLFEEYKEIYNILEARGKEVSGKRANKGIVLRALNIEFADELKKSNRQKLSNKITKQSKRITGSNAGLRSDHYDGDVTKDPYLHKLFAQFEAENG